MERSGDDSQSTLGSRIIRSSSIFRDTTESSVSSRMQCLKSELWCRRSRFSDGGGDNVGELNGTGGNL